MPTAHGLLEIERNINLITTGCSKLDSVIGGGIRPCLTEFVGISGAGKTTMCLQLIFNTIVPMNFGDKGGEAVYITTCKPNRDRITELAQVHADKWKQTTSTAASTSKIHKIKSQDDFTNIKASLSRIHHVRVFDVNELILAVYRITKFDRKVRIIVIDTFSTVLRSLKHSEQLRITSELLDVLSRYGNTNQCAIILTNELTPKISSDTSRLDSDFDPMKPALGNFYHHRLSQRILLAHLEGEKYLANVQKNCSGGPSVVRLRLGKEGFEDWSEDS